MAERAGAGAAHDGHAPDEGGWVASAHGEHVVLTTGRQLFHGSTETGAFGVKEISSGTARGAAWGVVGGKLWCFTAGDEKVVEAWDVEAGFTAAHKSKQLNKKIGELTFADGHVLAGDKTGEVFRLSFDAASGFGEPTFVLGHTASMITGLALCFGGKLIVTTDKDEHVRLTRYPDTHIIENFCYGHAGFISSLALLGDDRIVTGGGDGLVKVWRLPSGEAEFTDEFASRTVHALAVAEDAATKKATLLASVEEEGLFAYDAAGSVERSARLGDRAPTAIAASGATVVCTYIGTHSDDAPLVQRFKLEGGRLVPQPLSLPVNVPEVKPSFWQVELAKKRAMKSGEAVGERHTKKRSRLAVDEKAEP